MNVVSKIQLFEKRAFKRFGARRGSFAVTTAPHKLGRILDISKGGLSFTYVGEEKGPQTDIELDIFITGMGFKSKSIPYRTIADFEVEKKYEFSSVNMRRCGVMFRQLSLDQTSQIDDFLQNHTVVEG